jgi:hypothetical protein
MRHQSRDFEREHAMSDTKFGWKSVVLAAFIGFMVIGTLRHHPKASPATPAGETGAAVSKPPSQGAGLADIKLNIINLNKVGFGNILEATFSINNLNQYPVKDLTVTCKHVANSGTVIDSNTRTIYEMIPSRGSTYIRDFNMGFINNQMTGSACAVTGFSRA